VRIVRRHGLRLVTLTNGSADVADGLLTRAGLRGEFERLLSVEAADPFTADGIALAGFIPQSSLSVSAPASGF
jgi:hypothetical protein